MRRLPAPGRRIYMEDIDRVREEALRILHKVLRNSGYSNILLKNVGGRFTPLDRAFMTELVYGTIKYRLRIDYIIGKFSKLKLEKMSPYILTILEMGIYQISFMDRVPESAAVNESVKLAKKYGNVQSAGFVNGVLRNYCRRADAVSYPDRNKNPEKYFSVYYSYPEWLVKMIENDYGADFTEGFLRSGNEVPHVTVRVNRLKTSPSQLKDRLFGDGLATDDGPYLSDALTLKSSPGIENMDEWRQGLFTVQDVSSMLACRVLDPRPGELIMDLCSAPGTKSTYIGELMENSGTIISSDINAGKLRLINANASRLGIDIIHTLGHDAAKPFHEYQGRADRVLLDVPCSGLGIMRKKPEIRYNRNPHDIERICAMQAAILKASAPLVRRGGVLVYSTCTVLRRENTDMIAKFLDTEEGFVPESIEEFVPEGLKKRSCADGYIEIYPHQDKIDGFFICRLRKV